MVMAPRIDQRQTQTLVMTPQLQQAIKLLQMSNLELRAFIEQELERNPMLERDEGEVIDVESPDQEDYDDDIGINAEPLNAIKLDTLAPVEIPNDQALDVDYDDIYNNSNGNESLLRPEGPPGPFSVSSGHANFTDELPNLEETLSKQKTLREHLLEQLAVEVNDVSDRLIGGFLIDSLDDAGYLRNPLLEIANILGCEEQYLELILKKLRKFDPPGVFARDLADCLALQLQDRNRLDPAMQLLIENLDLLASGSLSQLETICGVNCDDLQDMIAEVRALNPKPAQDFVHEILRTIEPDVLMNESSSGGWNIELNPDTLPRVLVNNTYCFHVSNKMESKEDKSYVMEQAQSANWLVKAVDQRANTILKVASEIVQRQELFFKKGVKYLKPLILRDIADAIEMHESTVSRVTSNKFIATPRGVLEMKYFFTTAISSTQNGEMHSAEAVRHQIKELIECEEITNILSDDKLVLILKKSGVDIARRTVAKYRESMRIGSSVQRRRQKSNVP